MADASVFDVSSEDIRAKYAPLISSEDASYPSGAQQSVPTSSGDTSYSRTVPPSNNEDPFAISSADLRAKYSNLTPTASPADTGSAYLSAGGQRTWGDVGHDVASGYYSGLVAPVAELIGDSTDAAAARQSAAASTAAETPAGQTASGITPWLEKQAVPIVALAAPTLLTGGVLGAPAATALGAGLGAGMNVGGYKSEVAGAVEDTPTSELMKDPAFKADIDNGMSEANARLAQVQRNTTYTGEVLSAGPALWRVDLEAANSAAV